MSWVSDEPAATDAGALATRPDGGTPRRQGSAPDDDAGTARLEQAFARFFAEARIKPGTRRSYRANAANWLRHFRLPLEEVDRPLITEFVSRRKREGVTDVNRHPKGGSVAVSVQVRR